MKTIIIAGALANKHRNGGEAWVRLNWALGFRRLGWDVYFVEEIDSRNLVDRQGNTAASSESANVAFFRETVRAFGLEDSAALIVDGGAETIGIGPDALLRAAARSEVLLNISGHLSNESLLQRAMRKVFVDLDPGYTQYWHASGNLGARLAGHDIYFTVGSNVGAPGCCIPTGEISWIPVRQPVVLDLWPTHVAGTFDRFTTVASWRGAFGPVHHDGRVFGQKAHEFRRFRDVPTTTSHIFEIALDIDAADQKDRIALENAGWRLTDPARCAPTPSAFQRYVERSSAEFSVAQGIYVETNSGWFSDRTAYYLASGKPVLVQDTGFSRTLPVGEGLVSFTTPEEAAAGADLIVGDYQRQCRAARRVAEEFFSAEVVLTDCLRRMSLAA